MLSILLWSCLRSRQSTVSLTPAASTLALAARHAMRSPVPHAVLLHTTACFAGLAVVCASPLNITVDDNDPAVVYLPADDWSLGQECSACTARLNASRTYHGTWHDTLFSSTDTPEDRVQTVSYNFMGECSEAAPSVYC